MCGAYNHENNVSSQPRNSEEKKFDPQNPSNKKMDSSLSPNPHGSKRAGELKSLIVYDSSLKTSQVNGDYRLTTFICEKKERELFSCSTTLLTIVTTRDPSFIYSWSISHICEHEFYYLARAMIKVSPVLLKFLPLVISYFHGQNKCKIRVSVRTKKLI